MGFWGSVPQTDLFLGHTVLQPRDTAVVSGGDKQGDMAELVNSTAEGIGSPLVLVLPPKQICAYLVLLLSTVWHVFQRI